jgi:hypothetical protein
MVNMPAIRDGLTERFLGRVPKITNGDRIIAEGAAWIAHDGLRLTLSKPIEVLVADTIGTGTYYPLVDAGWPLPLENETQNVTNTRLFCTDPREGVAVLEIAKPAKLGRSSPNDPRQTLCVTRVLVDPKARPLLERIECHLQIDHDYVARVTLRSTGRGAETSEEFHDLDFGLSLSDQGQASEPETGDTEDPTKKASSPQRSRAMPLVNSNLLQRTNVILKGSERGDHDEMWRLVPGDLVDIWKPTYFDTRQRAATEQQLDERNFYVPCARCKRRISQIKAEGPVHGCRGSCGFGPRNAIENHIR